MDPANPNPDKPANRRKFWLRRTLRLSQKEAVASATMTATGDHFFNAFAIHLHANAVQMGWLTAFPQLIGAWMQLLSVWVGAHFSRRHLVVGAAATQALTVLLMALLAAVSTSQGITLLIMLAVIYHATMNLIQPHWRAWMGSVVPQRRRGTFFAARTRLTMMSSLVLFVGGGALLSYIDHWAMAWLGFTLLFSIAAIGRMISCRLLWQMHDPDPHSNSQAFQSFRHTLRQFRASLHHRTFRHYSFFVAGMQGVVAISAPFFAVYMLRDLQLTYLQFSLTIVASIATQFVTLRFWGRFCDRFGNRLVMVSTSYMIPILPALWLFSADFYYLIGVQIVSGIAWSGFSLSTANYLYDIRPHKTQFAAYAAVQASLGSTLVFCGALAGGHLAAAAPALAQWLPTELQPSSPLFLVFLCSAVFRLMIALWFIPRAVEPDLRQRPQLLELVLRVSRFNAISGVVLDWLTVTKKRKPW